MEKTILYDGECSFCTSWVRWVEKRAKDGTFHILSAQESERSRRFPEISAEALQASLHFVDEKKRVFRGAEAVRRILQEIPRYRLLSLLWKIPLAPYFLEKGYTFIAARRNSCALRQKRAK